jgi:predicted Zn-dependent peptidase
MTMILSNGHSARMIQNIINKGLAVEAWAQNSDNRYGGMIILGGSPNEPQTVKQEGIGAEEKRRAYLQACEELETILLAEVARMKTDPVSAAELQRIKKLIQRQFLERMRSNESLAGTLATIEVEIGWRYLLNYLAQLETVTPEDIRAAANKYIQTENQTSVYIIPGGQPDRPAESYAEFRSISGSAAARLVHPSDLKNISIYPTPAGWQHPLSFERKPQKVAYPPAELLDVADAKVFYLSDKELPLVDMTLLVKAGSVDLSESKTGLTDLLDDGLIRGGTATYSPFELALALDDHAIRLNVSIGEEDAAIHLSVLKDDWQTGLDILQEILTQPRFEESVFEIAKVQALTALKRQGERAEQVASRERDIWHFQGHPYGRDPLLGLKTIPAITREDLKQFVRSYFVPSNMIAAVAGDIEKESMLADLEKFFKALPQEPAPVRSLPDPKETPPALTLIHKPGQVQSQLALILPSVVRTHPDYWKINLLMQIFGGNDSLMYTRLRDDLGLVYSAYFYQTYKWTAGILQGFIGCKGDKTAAAIAETIHIMNMLRNDVPQNELEQKRMDSLNSFVFNVDSRLELVNTYGRYYMRQEPLDTLEKIQDSFFSASRDDLQRLAAKYLDPQKIQIFVVGDKLIQTKTDTGEERTLEEDLKILAKSLGLPYREIGLR